MSRETFGKDLMEEQEVAAGIADIVAAAYASESAWVRAGKLQSDLKSLAEAAVRVYTDSIRHDVWRAVESVLARLHSAGMALTDSEMTLHELLLPGGYHDVIGLRRQLAGAVLDRESYPWS